MKKFGILFALIAVLGLSTCAFAANTAITSNDYKASFPLSADTSTDVAPNVFAFTAKVDSPGFAIIGAGAFGYEKDVPGSPDVKNVFQVAAEGTGTLVINDPDGAGISRVTGGAVRPSFRITSSVANFQIKEGSLILSGDVTVTGGKFTLTNAVISALTVNGASAEVVITKGEKGPANFLVGGMGKPTTATSVLTFVAGGVDGNNDSRDVVFNGGLVIGAGHFTLNKSQATNASIDSKTAVVDIAGFETGAGYVYVKDGTVNVNSGAFGTFRMAENGTAAVAISGGSMDVQLVPGNKGELTLTGGNLRFTQWRGGKTIIDGEFESVANAVAIKKFIIGPLVVQGGEVDVIKAGALKYGAVTVGENTNAPATSGTVTLSAAESAGQATLNTGGKLILAAANAIPKTLTAPITSVNSGVNARLDLFGGTLVLQKPQEVYYIFAEAPAAAAVVGLVNLELTWNMGVKAARRSDVALSVGATAFKVTAVDVSAVKVNKGDKFPIFEVANTSEVRRDNLFREGKFEVSSALMADYEIVIENGPKVPGSDDQVEWQKVWLVALKDGPNPPDPSEFEATLNKNSVNMVNGGTDSVTVTYSGLEDGETVALENIDYDDSIFDVEYDEGVFSITANGVGSTTYTAKAKTSEGNEADISFTITATANADDVFDISGATDKYEIKAGVLYLKSDVINDGVLLTNGIIRSDYAYDYANLPTHTDYVLYEGSVNVEIVNDGEWTAEVPVKWKGQFAETVKVHFKGETTEPKKSSGGGCNTAYAPFALLLAAPLFFLRKKD